MVRRADPDVTSSSCPSLDETERCDCATYSVRWGDWVRERSELGLHHHAVLWDGVCVLWGDWGGCQRYGQSTCGPGRRQRHYDCVRHDDGIVVSRRLCAVNVRTKIIKP